MKLATCLKVTTLTPHLSWHISFQASIWALPYNGEHMHFGADQAKKPQNKQKDSSITAATHPTSAHMVQKGPTRWRSWGPSAQREDLGGPNSSLPNPNWAYQEDAVLRNRKTKDSVCTLKWEAQTGYKAKFFHRENRHDWKRFPRGAVQSPSLELLKTRLGKTPGGLVWSQSCPCLTQNGLETLASSSQPEWSHDQIYCIWAWYRLANSPIFILPLLVKTVVCSLQYCCYC